MLNGQKIPFCKPYIDYYESSYVASVVKKGWLTTGKITADFEKEFAEYVGAKHCVLVNSCTNALFLSVQWHKRNKEESEFFKAYVPSLTFAATATAPYNAGMNIVFGNVGKDMLLSHLPQEIVHVAIPVHLTGKKANTNYPLGVEVIEDSAHMIEAGQCRDNPNLVCFSFYATKNLCMGEGGAICTNDDEAAAWLKQARHHGISKGGWDRYKEGGSWLYDIEFVGWKCNPSDVLAAIVSANFSKMRDIDNERKRCIDLYNEELGYENTGLHLYPILVKERVKFMDAMKEKGIQCSVHFLPLHKMKAFKGNDRISTSKDMSGTEYFGERLVSLPLFPELTNEEIKYICKKVKQTNLLLPSLDLDSSVQDTSKQ